MGHDPRSLLERLLTLVDKKVTEFEKRKQLSHDDVLDITRLTSVLYKRAADEDRLVDKAAKGIAAKSTEELEVLAKQLGITLDKEIKNGEEG